MSNIRVINRLTYLSFSSLYPAMAGTVARYPVVPWNLRRFLFLRLVCKMCTDRVAVLGNAEIIRGRDCLRSALRYEMFAKPWLLTAAHMPPHMV